MVTVEVYLTKTSPQNRYGQNKPGILETNLRVEGGVLWTP